MVVQTVVCNVERVMMVMQVVSILAPAGLLTGQHAGVDRHEDCLQHNSCLFCAALPAAVIAQVDWVGLLR